MDEPADKIYTITILEKGTNTVINSDVIIKSDELMNMKRDQLRQELKKRIIEEIERLTTANKLNQLLKL